MTIYRVEYKGANCGYFPTRDLALDYIINEVRKDPLLVGAGDFEILDNSDEI